MLGLIEKDIDKRFNLDDICNHEWYKACKIILKEKKKILLANKFINDLINDNIFEFNELLKNMKNEKSDSKKNPIDKNEEIKNIEDEEIKEISR